MADSPKNRIFGRQGGGYLKGEARTMKAMAKFFAVGVRHNPQLGSYLYKLIVGTRKDNKCSISLKFTEYGCARSMKFARSMGAGAMAHYCIERDGSVYGSVTFIGFDTPDAAMAYVRKWNGDRRANEYMSILEKEAMA